MALLGGVRTESQSALYMERNLEHWKEHGFGVWMLRHRAQGEMAGRVLLRHLDLDGIDEVEVGYSLYPAYWGLGLAAEVAAACLERARDTLGFTRVVAITAPQNLRSQRVMTKVGMRFERDIQHDGHHLVLFRTADATSKPGDLSEP